MRDKPAIFAGLTLFLAVAAFPFWYNMAAGTTAAAPVLSLPPRGSQCVAATEFMRANHMRMLVAWRDQVVRTGVRQYSAPDGRTYEASLTRTCLAQCHQNRAEFCDRCHGYAGVSTLECWNCHNAPAAVQRSAR